MVSPIAGTTRDAVDSVIDWKGNRFGLWTRPGFAVKGKIELKAEKLSVVMATTTLGAQRCRFAADRRHPGVTALDAHIGGYAHEAGRSVIIVVNKWDIVAKNYPVTADFEREIREKLKFLSFAPIVFISAKTGSRVEKLYRTL